MSFYVLAGEYLNHLNLASAAPTPDPAADASFPVGYLYDRRSNVPFRWGSSATSHNIKVDLEKLSDPSFEVGVSGWSAQDGGTVTQSNTTANTGTYSLKITDTSSAYATRNVTARAGQTLKLSWALYGGGGSVEAAIRVLNRHTGNWLQSDGTWAATANKIDSQTTAEWKVGSLTFTLESATTSFNELASLTVGLYLSASGTVYFDDVSLLPGVTWSSVHGHNLTPQTGVKLQSSPDNSAWTDRITFTLRRDSFYGTVAAQYIRYWRLLLTSTVSVQPYLGEWVLGEYLSLTCAPDYPVAIDYPEAQARQGTPQGAQHVSLYGAAPARRLGLSFRFRNDTEFQQVRDVIYRLGRGGAYPSVWVPTETDPDVCVLGRTQDELQTQRVSYAIRAGEIEVLEEPLPLME